MKILIVEDEQASFAYLKKIIQTHHRCEIYSASNGIEALKLLENEKFDGIIADVSMPLMTGIELLEILVSNPDTNRIPIMMTSANNTRSDVEHALELGASDYLLKPLMAHETLSRINRFIELIKCKSDEVKNNKANIEQKSLLIITNNRENWSTIVEKLNPDFSIIIFDSAPEGLEYYLKNLTAIVVLDEGIKTISEEFIAKKIKKFIADKALKGVILNTKIFVVGKNKINQDFDYNIAEPEMIEELLNQIYHKESIN